ncbi:MAG: YjjG family noncanonical pyrimidine nucleotidase [Clostridia bacterium]|nr:YjjG family noncanonical pyrimidine nucleotidase [Clostridia bacterium]
MFDVILWDVDGTLLDFLAAEKAAIRACFTEMGLGECTDEQIARYSIINKKYWKRMEDGEISKAEVLSGRFEEFFAGEGVEANVDDFNVLYQTRLGDTVVFFDGADSLLCEFRGRVKQYAVTNGTQRAQRRKLANSGLDRIFDGIFISDEIGHEKPSREFFDRVFETIGGVSKNRVLIVGDSISSDIRGGKNAGIRTCWYNPSGAQAPEGMRPDYEIKNLGEVRYILDGQ